MKSLNELWEENGCKPINVRKIDWNNGISFFIREKTPSCDFIGYWNESGNGDCIIDYDASLSRWELYEETEEKTFYKVIEFVNEIYRESSSLFETEEQAKGCFGENFVRLLTEYPIKIKVKK